MEFMKPSVNAGQDVYVVPDGQTFEISEAWVNGRKALLRVDDGSGRLLVEPGDTVITVLEADGRAHVSAERKAKQ
jgi:hypothetical protein